MDSSFLSRSSLLHESRCATVGCISRTQATCLSCMAIFCFKCSLIHAEKQGTERHRILEFQEAIDQFSKRSKTLYNLLKRSVESEDYKAQQAKQAEILQVSMFETELKELEKIKAVFTDIFEQFFRQINLELVDLWERYLTKFSGIYAGREEKELMEKLLTFTEGEELFHKSESLYLQDYYSFDFDLSVTQICKKRKQQLDCNPDFPKIKLIENHQAEFRHFLSRTIYTTDHRRQKETHTTALKISHPNYFQKQPQLLPIFPIKKECCYIYDFRERVYEVLQLENLIALPEFPKTILLPNNDLHIIGGIQKDQILSAEHIVFRPSSRQIFKLAPLPSPKCPYNGLIYVKDAIYVIGGHSGKQQWDTECLKYKIPTKQWKKIASLNYSKPSQSCCVYNEHIYCFGIAKNDLKCPNQSNIEKYHLKDDRWSLVQVSNPLSNPFNFSGSFASIQINENEILLFGGKKFIVTEQNTIRSDRQLCPEMYLYRPESQSWIQLGRLGTGIGVQYGQLNPIIRNSKVYSIEFLLTQNNPVVRWYETVQLIEIGAKGTVESLMIFHEE